ncbi:cobalamin biosynthesis protein [Amycolatopsis thermophila]|uniref:Cobalamin biosynthesis protein CobD n=1 Tax=Amycolatopsis thermophila TaxID=206084 RepID=A0ABU0EXT4_9PSEU|nr:cobalamin biosynthesis protein [Amycolatopsis thermophila]MDQ0379582.1 adenosylcobinamide-phosphate synthase [Amycolatopsis thermophila]
MVYARSLTALGLAAGYALDAALGDPRRGHPVALFGRAAKALERRVWADSRTRGAAYAATCVGAAAGLGALAQAAARRPAARVAVTALATWTVLGGRGLAAEGEAMADRLAAGNVPAARQRLGHLCGRDASGLDEKGLARAATESVAENTSDAVVAPLLWGAVAGVPGLLGYRALNTLDAMVGHRTPRFERFGWASARGDDLANLLPARVGALATAACARVVGGRAGRSLRVWRRDAAQHPSPNAGQIEAAFAGALDVRLGGVNTYGGRTEDRGTLGDGPAPDAADLRRAVRLSRAVGLAALAVAVAVAR